MTNSILLVGASGRVGRMVARAWQIDRRSLGQVVMQTRRLDASNDVSSLLWDPMIGAAPLLQWVARHGAPQAMVVLAGVTPGDGQDLALNSDIAVSCVTAAMTAHIPRVLIASSSAVYGVGDGTAFTESAICQPANAYGEAKVAMENACHALTGSGIEICCLRIGNVAGADALLLNVAQRVSDDAVTIDTFANGRGPVRSYIGPKSLARVLATLALQDTVLPPILNIAAPEPISMDMLAEAAEHTWTARPAPKYAQQRITLDSTLLGKFYRLTPEESYPSQMVLQWKETMTK